MNGLHAGDNSMLAKGGNISRIDDLRMLDPPAPIACVGAAKPVDGGENISIRAIANRMNRKLKICLLYTSDAADE